MELWLVSRLPLIFVLSWVSGWSAAPAELHFLVRFGLRFQHPPHSAVKESVGFIGGPVHASTFVASQV